MLAPRPQKLLSSVPADVSTRTPDHLIHPPIRTALLLCSLWHVQTRCVGLNRETVSKMRGSRTNVGSPSMALCLFHVYRHTYTAGVL